MSAFHNIIVVGVEFDTSPVSFEDWRVRRFVEEGFTKLLPPVGDVTPALAQSEDANPNPPQYSDVWVGAQVPT